MREKMEKIANFSHTEHSKAFVSIIEDKFLQNHKRLVRETDNIKLNRLLAKEQAYLEMINVLNGADTAKENLDKTFADVSSRLSIMTQK